MSSLYRNITLLSVAAFAINFGACAQRYWQRIDVALNVGYATFSMSDLKDLQNEQMSYLPLDGKITNSFPGYLNFSVEGVFYDSSYFVGTLIGHTSTGGRINYSDYSGSVTMDQLVKMNYNGLVGALRIASTKAGNIFVGMNLLTYFNRVEMKYSEVVLGESASTSFKLQSINVALGPFVQLHKRLGKLFIKGYAGYELHLGMDLTYDGSDQKYTNNSNENVKVNADGLRAGIGVGYAVYTRRPGENRQ
jgi:hypothetical protein